MAEPRWRLANVLDVPGVAGLPPPDDGVTPEEREAARAEIRGETTGRVELPGYPELSRKWHALRRFFGVTAFGVTAVEAEAGKALVPPHHELPYGQEELYVVIDGRVRFVCDGEEVEAGRGDALFLEPEVVRGAIALTTPTVLLLIGGKRGAYEPPTWASDWRPPQEWLARHRAAAERATDPAG